MYNITRQSAALLFFILKILSHNFFVIFAISFEFHSLARKFQFGGI